MTTGRPSPCTSIETPRASVAERTTSAAFSITLAPSVSCSSRRSLPLRMRERSSRSSIRRAWLRTLWTIRSLACAACAGSCSEAFQHLDPGQRRLQRRAQLVRHLGEEAVLERVRLVGGGVRRLRLRGRGRELLGALEHAPLERGAFLAQRRLGVAPAADLRLERVAGRAQLRRARDREDARDQADQRRRGQQRRHRGDELDVRRQPVVGIPDRPDLDPVRRAAADDEDREQDDDPVERQVGALPHQVQQRDRDRDVGQADRAVADDVGPEQARVPGEAVAVRQQASGAALLRREDREPGDRDREACRDDPHEANGTVHLRSLVQPRRARLLHGRPGVNNRP
jgi:hypothetical protein